MLEFGVCISESGPAVVGVDAGVVRLEPGVCIKGSGSAAGVEAGSLCSSSAIVVAKIRISKSDEFDSA